MRQRILQRQVVHRLDADRLPRHFRRRFGGLLALLRGFRLGRAVVVRLGALDHAVEDVGGARGVLGVKHVLGRGHEVVGRHIRHRFAVAVHPFHALAQVERPGQAVLAHFPALRQGRLHAPVLVVLYQGINQVGCQGELVRRTGGQVVQGGHFAGIQNAIDVVVRDSDGARGQNQRGAQQDSQNPPHHVPSF